MMADIVGGNCFCVENGEHRVVGTFSLIFGEDPTYKIIRKGHWLNDLPYATIHRMASDGSVRGVAETCLDFCFKRADNLRADTHADNKVMQTVLKKHGFHYCGRINCWNGTERLAFHCFLCGVEMKRLAQKYNSPDFIKEDPVQFPHRYSDKRDMEISAFVTAWLSWGNRRQIVQHADYLDREIMEGCPTRYILGEKWRMFKDDGRCLYRTFKWNDFFRLCVCLNGIYRVHGSMEKAVLHGMLRGKTLLVALADLFDGVKGIADPHKSSPCKRLWMFLRWMVRRDGIVDLGIWQTLNPDWLQIPLDTHVFQEACRLGITKRKTADQKTAKEITDYFRTVFPQDAAQGDFALFGLGMDGK